MDIFKIFRDARNPDKAAPMSEYMRGLFPFLGIQKPERTKLSREFLKAKCREPLDWQFVFKCWDQPEREFQYLAIDYLGKMKPSLTAAHIPNIRTLVVTKPWWDTVDGLDMIVGDIAHRIPEVNEIMLEWSLDEDIWLRRIAIDHQLTRKEKTDEALLEKIIVNNLGQTEFFINKAIGWSLRDYSKTNPDWVRDFLERYGSRMAALSVREARKYI